ncbi:hypothetical protein MUK42_19335 [Musa troglodytarum]|uniref:Uncharacterized protein n=1 Tax=Musa troglodytarum TaxID=320322 RepID=A0A9E7JZM1_9LILI|nr:hypothetical protein MUK42_19335 [Musa troglodytarum]URE00667.1 hypothetical protein MUK42_19335 [Musa troglodytarum]URE00668.1 hypothetical protein MUK42_19335 [Musa troglodytarum]
MGLQAAGTRLHRPQLTPTNTPTASRAAFPAVASSPVKRLLASAFLGTGSARLCRSRSLEIRWGRGRRSQERVLRRAFSASIERFAGKGGDYEDELGDEVLGQRLEDTALDLQRQQGDGGEDDATHSESWSEEGDALAPSVSLCSDSSPAPSPPPPSGSKKQEPSTEPPWLPVCPELPDWPDQIVPASVEKNANSMELPLSLRIIKRKKRWEEGWFLEAGESACCSVKRAFSTMVFMIRELQNHTLQMREVIYREDIQGILARVQREMNFSFVWLFQQIFSCTPTLMVSVMLLLANFTVYSMGHLDDAAMATPNPPIQSMVVVEDLGQNHEERSSIRLFSSIGTRTASVGGTGAGGGGNAKPVAGATDDGRSDDVSLSYRKILYDGTWRATAVVNTEEGGGGEDAFVAEATVVEEAEEARVWKGILEEVSRMNADTRHAALMDPETLLRLVSPITVELAPDDYPVYLRTEIMYQQALSQDPENSLLLANFAQFLYLVLGDHDRAEYYFKKAAGLEPADAEALSRYASFLWLARKDLVAAEETFLEAIDADPSNSVHNANYARFLWNTGGDGTCYPLDCSDA